MGHSSLMFHDGIFRGAKGRQEEAPLGLTCKER